MASSSSSTKVKPLEIQTIPLSNGATLYFKSLPSAPRVAFGVYTFGGNRLDPKPGLTDVVDNLLNEGTHKRTSEQIAVELDGLSLSLDNDTRRDYCVMSGACLKEDLAESLELVADLLFNSTMADVEKEKVRLTGELTMELDSPRAKSHDLLTDTLFEGTPYRASLSKLRAMLPTIKSSEELLEHYRRIYHPANMVISVVGNVEPDLIRSLLEACFVRPDGGAGSSLADANKLDCPTLKESKMVTGSQEESNQMHIYKAWFAPQLSHADYVPLWLLNNILGGKGLTSRMFLELRDKQGLAYTVRSQYEASKYLGVFSLYIGTDPSNREKALKGFDVECQKLMDIPVSAAELADSKENLMGKQQIYLETAHQQSLYIGAQLSLGLTIADINSWMDRLAGVTADDIQRVAQSTFSAPSIISAVGPSKYL